MIIKKVTKLCIMNVLESEDIYVVIEMDKKYKRKLLRCMNTRIINKKIHYCKECSYKKTLVEYNDYIIEWLENYITEENIRDMNIDIIITNEKTKEDIFIKIKKMENDEDKMDKKYDIEEFDIEKFDIELF